MDKREEIDALILLCRWAIQEVDDLYALNLHESAEDELSSRVAHAILPALSQARSQAYEECAKIALTAGPRHYAENHPGYERGVVELESFIAQAIREAASNPDRSET